MKVTICKHPFIAWLLTQLRDENTEPKDFHRLVLDISRFLLYEACGGLRSQKTTVKTPTGETATGHNPLHQILVVPVLRAGIGMSNAAMECIPGVQVCHLGLERNETTFEPRTYYKKRPKGNTKDLRCFVVDPMLATGGSACDALNRVKGWGVKYVSLVCIIAAPQGIKAVNRRHPDVSIAVAAVDRGLNKQMYILPGLGDAGDRQFNT